MSECPRRQRPVRLSAIGPRLAAIVLSAIDFFIADVNRLSRPACDRGAIDGDMLTAALR
jgi:hypothetical protein